MFKDKGIILVEVLWAIFIFGVVLLSVIPMFQQLVSERNHRMEEYTALMIARTEMENSQRQLIAKEYSQGQYRIQIDMEPYISSIVEVQVIVKWEEDVNQKKQLILKKLVYQKQ